MSQWLTLSTQVRALAKAISTALAAAGLSQEELFPGQIAHTDLPWAAPPLRTSLLLGGVPLQDYLDSPVRLEEAKLEGFWRQTLAQMWYEPSRLVRKGAIANCAWAMPRAALAQRMLRFSVPAGWPQHTSELAGAQFTLELAHTAAISLPYDQLQCDDSNYWVRLRSGLTIGIADGKILTESPWEMDVSGQVLDLLEMTRGAVSYDCHFDQIASVRSVLYTHQGRFRQNFEALDLALQALRLLATGQHCPALTQVMRVAPVDMALQREREHALHESLEVLASDMSGRDKLRTMHSLLVPVVLTETGFRRCIFSGRQYPFTMAAGKEEALRQWLIETYQQLPAELQKAGVCSL